MLYYLFDLRVSHQTKGTVVFLNKLLTQKNVGLFSINYFPPKTKQNAPQQQHKTDLSKKTTTKTKTNQNNNKPKNDNHKTRRNKTKQHKNKTSPHTSTVVKRPPACD